MCFYIFAHRYFPLYYRIVLCSTVAFSIRSFLLSNQAKHFVDTHSSLILRLYCWMKSVASAVLRNINIRTMSSTGNAVGRGPTVWAQFKVFKALALTCRHRHLKIM